MLDNFKIPDWFIPFILFDAAYVGLATVAGFIWWFVYADTGPKLPYSELVRCSIEVVFIAKIILFEFSSWYKMSLF